MTLSFHGEHINKPEARMKKAQLKMWTSARKAAKHHLELKGDWSICARMMIVAHSS